jgi:hypothetical protein
MVKVIETNLSIEDNCIKDHQSRVIEVDSWESYVEEIKEKTQVYRKSIIGYLEGVSIPYCTIDKWLYCDDFHLALDFQLDNGMMRKRLAYRV